MSAQESHLKKKQRRESNRKLERRVKADPEFAKAYFQKKSERSAARKKAFKNRFGRK